MSTNNPPFFECKYCLKKILKKATFDKHSCERKKRYELCKKSAGYLAFEDYKYWLSFKKRSVVDLSTFVDSSFFTSFINFQELLHKKGIPDRKLFIRLAVELKMSPKLWGSEEMYELYIKYYDENVKPIEQVITSIRTLCTIADAVDCDISEAFNHLMISEISLLVFQRKLSPWLLLLSPKFLNILHTVNDTSQYIMLTTLLKPKEWGAQFKANPIIVSEIKKMVSELEL